VVAAADMGQLSGGPLSTRWTEGRKSSWERRRHQDHREGVRRERPERAYAQRRAPRPLRVSLRSAQAPRLTKGGVPRCGEDQRRSHPGHRGGRRRQRRLPGGRLGLEQHHLRHVVQLVGQWRRLCRVHGSKRTAPVRVAARDTTGDDIADAILAVQGPGGTTDEIRAFNITNVSPLEVSPFTAVSRAASRAPTSSRQSTIRLPSCHLGSTARRPPTAS
jgi:hypothetical protein